MLSPEDVASLRRSQAMAPLSAHHVELLLEVCAIAARERQELVCIVAELREAFPPVRDAISKMAMLTSTARDRQLAIVMAGELSRALPALRAPLNRLARLAVDSPARGGDSR